jgi:hypothetical protein
VLPNSTMTAPGMVQLFGLDCVDECSEHASTLGGCAPQHHDTNDRVQPENPHSECNGIPHCCSTDRIVKGVVAAVRVALQRAADHGTRLHREGVQRAEPVADCTRMPRHTGM